MAKREKKPTRAEKIKMSGTRKPPVSKYARKNAKPKKEEGK